MQTGGCWLPSAFCSYLSLAARKEIGEYFPSRLFALLYSSCLYPITNESAVFPLTSVCLYLNWENVTSNI